MLFHPLIQFETARQRQSDVLLRAEQYRLIQEARTVKHDDHGLIKARALNTRRPPARTAPAGEFMSAPARKPAQPLSQGELSRMTCVEHLQEQLRALVAQRQGLREREASRGELESNRVELARLQRQLSQAFIDLHVRQCGREAA
jgi:hypothetical protein